MLIPKWELLLHISQQQTKHKQNKSWHRDSEAVKDSFYPATILTPARTCPGIQVLEQVAVIGIRGLQGQNLVL